MIWPNVHRWDNDTQPSGKGSHEKPTLTIVHQRALETLPSDISTYLLSLPQRIPQSNFIRNTSVRWTSALSVISPQGSIRGRIPMTLLTLELYSSPKFNLMPKVRSWRRSKVWETLGNTTNLTWLMWNRYNKTKAENHNPARQIRSSPCRSPP